MFVWWVLGWVFFLGGGGGVIVVVVAAGVWRWWGRGEKGGGGENGVAFRRFLTSARHADKYNVNRLCNIIS